MKFSQYWRLNTQKNRNFLETSTHILKNFFPDIPSTMQKVQVDWSLNVFYNVKLHTL
jgi:hypothetical protein